MLFILTNSQDATTSFLTVALEKSRLPFVRLDTDLLLQDAAFEYRARTPRFKINGLWHVPNEISHVWYRRPEELKHERLEDTPEGKYTRAEWTEFIENFFAHVPKVKWINHPSCNAAASRKLEQLTTASALGIKTPETLATQEADE